MPMLMPFISLISSSQPFQDTLLGAGFAVLLDMDMLVGLEGVCCIVGKLDAAEGSVSGTMKTRTCTWAVFIRKTLDQGELVLDGATLLSRAFFGSKLLVSLRCKILTGKRCGCILVNVLWGSSLLQGNLQAIFVSIDNKAAGD